MNKLQKGFSAVELVIILVIVGLLGAGGWYVWAHHDKKPAKSSSSSASSSSVKKKAAVDPTSDWVTYSNAAGDYSFKHPAAWVFAAHPELCGDTLVLFAPVAASLGTCASENGGQMQASYTVGDVRADYQLDDAFYTGTTTAAVTVDGVVGSKISTTVMGMEAVSAVGGLPDNTTIVRYLFFTNGNTYAISYYQLPTYPDALSDFNLLATSTFKFSE